MFERNARATSPGGPEENGKARSSWAPALAWFSILAVAGGSLHYYFSRGLTNLYGDGLAHMEGARRLFDSLTPGYPEIGSVWLPLYHLLVAPLAINDYFWRTGLGGSLVSTTAYAFTAWILFRLGSEMNRNLAAGGVALGAFLLCPNMAYLATMPLTEPLTALWAVLVTYSLYRFHEYGRTSTLIWAGLAAFCGTLTRYDGWFLLPFAALYVFFAREGSWTERFRRAIIFCGIAGLGPALWLLHNACRFGNPIDFYDGPDSAQAIYAHQLATTGFRYPTDGSWLISARYYLADLALVVGVWPLEIAVLGLVALALESRERARRSAALLLLVPFPFYVQSMAHAAVGLYVPTLFPFTYYNLRYGLEMMPAVALLPSFLFPRHVPARFRGFLLLAFLGVIAAQATAQLSNGPRALPLVEESVRNTPCTTGAQEAVTRYLRDQYQGQIILADRGAWSCAFARAGIHFRKTISDSNRAIWKQLPSGAGRWVGLILREDGGPVDWLMRAYPAGFANFVLAGRYNFPGEASVEIYRLKTETKGP